MNVLGNIFWLLLGGLVLGILWALAGLLCCVTIIGIPFGVQCFKIAGLVLSPFGKEIEGGGGPGSCLMNVVWILTFTQSGNGVRMKFSPGTLSTAV